MKTYLVPGPAGLGLDWGDNCADVKISTFYLHA